jgi:hypothetical protein
MFCKEHTGANDATVSLLGEGGQGVVYNCSSASMNFEAAEKLYRYVGSTSFFDKELLAINFGFGENANCRPSHV